MPKQKKSKSQLETKSRQRNVNFLIEKDKKRDAEGSMARQVALEKLGIQEEFGFKDHDGIYSYADYSAPIKMLDASVAPPAVTEYPAYPRSEFSTPPAFNVAVDRNKKSTQDTVLPGSPCHSLSGFFASSPCPENYGYKQYCRFGAAAPLNLQIE